jgi:hypothetical protein
VRARTLWGIAGLCTALLGGTGAARADLDLTLHLQLDPMNPALFRYTEPQRPNHLRAALEELSLLSLELANYAHDHDLNSRDWDFGYTWTGIGRKLAGRGYSFDTNSFDTNFITHPGAGMLYYLAARSNRLGVFESFLFAALTSAMWEYFGELRERASINDLVATPIAGLVFGEIMMQLGLLFDRSCDSPRNRALGSVFAPFKSLHDAIDAARPARDRTCDTRDLTLRGEHEFRFGVEAGALLATRAPVQIETRVGLHTRIVAIEDYARPGRGFRMFSEGNITELWLSGAWAGATWNDFSVRGNLMPLGLHYRALAADGGGVHGDELVLGLLVGSEYNVHRYGLGAGVPRQTDRYFGLDAPGVSFTYRHWWGTTRLELELQASLTLAGIDAFAIPHLPDRTAIDSLTSIARANSYNYAAGFRVHPRARLVGSWFEAGAELSALHVTVITSDDRYPKRESHVPGEERRLFAGAWFRAGPAGWPVRLAVSAGLLQRAGAIATSHLERAELHLLGGLETAL